MIRVTIAEASKRLGKLIDLAAAGEAVSITREGQPVVNLVAERPARKPIDVEAKRRASHGEAAI